MNDYADGDYEKAAFNELKRRFKYDMESEMYGDDNLFRRFLKARDLNVDDAEIMLRQHLEWRKKNDLENIFMWTCPEVIQKHFFLTVLGNDKDDNIVKYNHFANTDFRGIFESCSLEDWLRSLIYLFENDCLEMKKQSQKLGKIVDKTIYIENFEGFSLGKATDRKVVSYLIHSISMYLNNYPESLKAVYVLNAPVYFNIFFALLRVCLPTTVIKKIKIYSDDSWKNDLLEIIDAEILPAFLGGKRTDPDGNPLCQELLPDPTPVPKSLYLNRSKKQLPTIKDAKKVSISRASTHELSVEVKEPGAHLEWEFEVKSGDIRFGIFYKISEGEQSEVVPPHKVNTSEYTESGINRCEKTGTYIVIFDNSYSILKSKDIWYKINVTSPTEEKGSLIMH